MNNQLFQAAAVVSMFAGVSIAASPASAALKYPYDLAVDQNSGKLYIADPGASQIALYNPASNTVSTFVTQSNPFSLAVNSHGLVYVGIVGASSQIRVLNPQAQTLDTLPVPPGDSPITMTFDADNILYQSNGYIGNSANVAEINSYSTDFSIQYSQYVGQINPYYQLQTYTALTANVRYSLAYDDGQIFVLADTSIFRPNVYDAQTLLSGHATDIAVPIQNIVGSSWAQNHHLAMIGSAFAAAVDANHNIFYTDPDNNDIAVTGKAITPKTLLTNPSSQPFGIAFDKVRSRLYVSFPEEHLVRAYTVTYTTQNGIKIPALSMPPTLIQ